MPIIRITENWTTYKLPVKNTASIPIFCLGATWRRTINGNGMRRTIRSANAFNTPPLIPNPAGLRHLPLVMVISQALATGEQMKMVISTRIIVYMEMKVMVA